VSKNKIKITRITLNAATFHGEVLEPTNINFIFGKNGTGKSTIARTILEGSALEWNSPTDESLTDIQVFNEEFIEHNILSTDDMPGVFTISEEDIEIEKEIESQTGILDNAKKEVKKSREAISKVESDIGSLKVTTYDSCWTLCKPLLDKFKKADVNHSSKEGLFSQLLEVTSPAHHSDADLESQYKIVYDSAAKIYPLLTLLPIGKLPACKLLAEPIIAKEDSQYSRFMSELGATDWVREGHMHYEHNKENRCPYCQREFTSDILDAIAECFNKSYEDTIAEIVQFQKDYESFFQRIMAIINENNKEDVPGLQPDKIKRLMVNVQNALLRNMSAIELKIKKPTETHPIEDLTLVFEEYNTEIQRINAAIEENNARVADKNKKFLFTRALREELAYRCSSVISGYRKKKAEYETEKEKKTTEYNTTMALITATTNKLEELSKHTTGTVSVINSINTLLKESGFEGFMIAPNEAKENTYKIVRLSGEPADSLSEGEKNFICFLYFYFSVFGNFDGSQNLKDRVVVIDDPVSSMDSDAVFIISSLIRNMIEVCNNAYTSYPDENIQKHIKQIFLLTHNSFFYNEIAPLYVDWNDHAAYFEVHKVNNESSIRRCVQLVHEGLEDKEVNHIPEIGGYSALWEEYKCADRPTVLMNVIRRILEVYFLQNLGIKQGDLYKEILETNKGAFIEDISGTKDSSKLLLARAMICYIQATSTGIDTLHFSPSIDDMPKYREVFKMIFKVMKQDQHYEMMINR
jgi:wobble nucleotide-excising tRNase